MSWTLVFEVDALARLLDGLLKGGSINYHRKVFLGQSFYVLSSCELFLGWFYKLALLDFELIFEVKMQESEGV